MQFEMQKESRLEDRPALCADQSSPSVRRVTSFAEKHVGARRNDKRRQVRRRRLIRRARRRDGW